MKEIFEEAQAILRTVKREADKKMRGEEREKKKLVVKSSEVASVEA